MTDYKHEVRRPTDYNNGQIYGWNGGDCPVRPETVVRVWFDSQQSRENKATFLRWSKDTTGLDADIISFQVVKAYVEPKVIWVNEYGTFGSVWQSEQEARDGAAQVEEDATRIAVKYQEVKE